MSGVHDIAVMGDTEGTAVVTDDDGLSVEEAAGAGGGIAVMADGDMPCQRTEHILGENVGDPPHAGVDAYLFTVRRGDASAFLAAVLEGKKCEKGKAGYILVRGIDTENAASFVQDCLPLAYLDRFRNIIIA
jgi:hypothetical protein